MRIRQKTFAVGVALLTSVCAAFAATTPEPFTDSPEPVTVKIIAMNEYHGNKAHPAGTTTAPDTTDPTKTVKVPTGGIAFAATLVQQLKAENPLNATVQAGDLIGASPLSSALFHEEPAIETLNLLGIDFAAVGNHEFDKG